MDQSVTWSPMLVLEEDIAQNGKDRDCEWLCEDICDHSFRPNVVEHDNLGLDLLTEERDAGGDMLHPLGRGVVVRELNCRHIVAKDYSW